MGKTAIVQARIEPGLKSNVETILNSLGMSTTDAINIYFKQIELASGLPFAVEIPNEKTKKAIREGNTGKGKEFKSTSDLFDDLNR